MKLRIQLLALFFLTVSVLPLACLKNYDVPPLVTSQSTSTPTSATSTPTPACTTTFGNWEHTCVSGIEWGYSMIWNYDINGTYQYGVSLALAVNCAPETTDAVTLTGPGVNLPLAYTGPITFSGTVYANYQSVTVTGNLVSGDSYTLTSVTSIGTAYSSVPLHEPITLVGIGGDLYVVNWNGLSCGLNFFSYLPLYCETTGAGFVGNGPVTFMGNEWQGCTVPTLMGAQLFGANTNITGGTGVLNITNGDIIPYP